jgi:hypothetical protein
MSNENSGNFSGESWSSNGDGTWSKEGKDGSYLHSDKSESNRSRDRDHVHTYSDGNYSWKENGKNSGGSNEVNETASQGLGSLIGWLFK